MADSWYQNARDNILGAGVHARIDLDADQISVILNDDGGRVFTIADQDVTDVAAGAIGTAGGYAVTTPTFGAGGLGVGIFDHADTVITGVTTATTVEALIYADTTPATAGVQPLIWYIDGWTGLGFTPNGGNITLAPATGGVYSLNAT